MRQKEWTLLENILLDQDIILEWWWMIPQEKEIWPVSYVVRHIQINTFFWKQRHLSDLSVHTHTIELSGTTLSSRFACAVIVIIFASIRLLMEASKFCYEPKSYICDRVKFFEVSMFILSIIFVSVFWTPCVCPLKWQWQIGVVAVFLAWINLIGFCANFPSIGIYIIMFGRIFITFVRVVILSMFLLTTFAITFYMTSETPFQVNHIKSNRPITSVPVKFILLQLCVFFNLFILIFKIFIFFYFLLTVG